MLRLKPGSIVWAGFCLITLCFYVNADPSLSRAQQGARESLIEAAKKEGEVVWHTTTSNEDNQVIVRGFNRKYPFLKVQVLRTTGEKLRARILTEAAAGRYFSDVTVMSGMELGLLRSRNLLQPYRSPEAAAYPAGAKDRDGTFTGIYARNFVIAYNKRMVPEKAAPRDWPDLLKPDWKEKIGLEEEEFEWYGTLVDFILSAEGQAMIRDRFRVPVRSGVAPVAPKLEQSDLKLRYVPSDMFKRIAQYEKEYREIFWQAR